MDTLPRFHRLRIHVPRTAAHAAYRLRFDWRILIRSGRADHHLPRPEHDARLAPAANHLTRAAAWTAAPGRVVLPPFRSGSNRAHNREDAQPMALQTSVVREAAQPTRGRDPRAAG